MNGREDDLALAPAGRLDLPPTGSGALDGVRVAVKDLYDVAGTVTGAGNPTLAAGPAAEADAAAVAALRAAGATVVAKTATDELAMGMFGVNAHYGTPPNPAAPGRVPGGSSSGAASMVAAGAADLGLGTDTGGSVRVPAAFCGLVGLRPSHGRIDPAGVRPMAPGFDTVGLIARRTAPIRTALGALSPRLPERSIEALVLLTDLVEVADDRVRERAEGTARAWADALGLDLRRDRLSLGRVPSDLVAVFWPLMSRQLWASNGAWLERDRPVLGTGIEDRIRAAGDVGDDEEAAATVHRGALRSRLDEVLGDAIAVLPTTWAPPPRVDSDHGTLMAWRDRNLQLVVPAPLTGSPQVTLPAGTIHEDGGELPVGVSLLGLPGDDELLLTLAEAVTPPGPTGAQDRDG